IVGTQHTTRAELDRVSRQYVGTNLFHLDISRLRHDLASLAWVSRVEIEKKLPDTLRVQVVERTPVALAQDRDRIAYVDDRGAAYAELRFGGRFGVKPLRARAAAAIVPRAVIPAQISN